MIKVIKKGNIITISGHANYNDSNDIVCASVSSIMYTTVNAILHFDNKAIDYKDDNNIVTIKINKNDNITNVLINNMMSLFNSLVNDYPKNIKIDEED